MAITDTTIKTALLPCTGGALEYSFNFKVLSKEELSVYYYDADGAYTLLTFGSDYTVEPFFASLESGGEVILTFTPETDHSILIIRNTDKKQYYDPVSGGGLSSSGIEKALDRAIMVLQEMRLIDIDPSETSGLIMPPLSEMAEHFLAFNAEGEIIPADPTNVPVTDFMKTVLDDETESAARTTLGLGTAAVEDVQTSSTDTTADRLMAVGAFGLGSDAISADASISIDDNDLPQGIYRYNSSSTPGTPPFGSVGLWMHFNVANGVRAHQLFFPQGRAELHTRQYDGSDWSSWNELLHDDDFPSDSSWTTTTSLDNDWTGTVKYIKRAGWVTVTVDVDGSGKSANTILTLSSGYRPSEQVWAGAQDNAAADVLLMTTSGDMQSNGASSKVRGMLTFPVL